jgi:ectoine hydroxylase-related dioxygenase (phytanoyl-CoA dioxygenase family)
MTADDRRSLDERGYLVLPARLAVSRELLSQLEALFERAGENAGHEFRADEPFARTLAIPSDEPGAFAPLASDPAVLECVEYLLGRDFALTAMCARSSNPFALALNPPRPGPGPSACRALWLLDSFTDDGAATLCVVPGSHLLDASAAAPPGDLAVSSLAAAAGSVVVLDGRLWSAAAANPGNRHLRSLRCEYTRRGTRNSG